MNFNYLGIVDALNMWGLASLRCLNGIHSSRIVLQIRIQLVFVIYVDCCCGIGILLVFIASAN